MVNEEYDKSGVQRYNPKPDRNITPPYMRNSVSQSFLDKNPQYRELFHTCASCSKNSLKPVNSRNLTPFQLKKIANTVERRCTLCGYRHIPPIK